LKSNSATRSIKVTKAKLGSRRHEGEAFSEKSKKKTSLKSFEVRAILGEKKVCKLRASTATNNYQSIPSFKVSKDNEVHREKSIAIRSLYPKEHV
jgi:hypothetical protein